MYLLDFLVRSYPSYPQFLEVYLDLHRQFHRLFVEVGQLGVLMALIV